VTTLPDGWTWRTLGDIAEVVGGVTKDTKKQSDPRNVEVPYLRVANVQRGFLDLSNVTTIRVPAETARRLELQRGDVLLNEGGDRDKLGRGWVWNDQVPQCIHQNHVFRARIRDDTLEPKLLAYYANELAREWFGRNATQTVNLASISLSKIKQLPVPIPPAADQQRIVEILEDHLSRLDAATDYLRSARARALAWRRSLVQNAVWGTNARLMAVAGLLREPMRNGHSARATLDGSGVRTLTLTAVTKRSFVDQYTKHTAADPDRVESLWLSPNDILVQRSNTPELVGTSAIFKGPEQWAIFPDLLIRLRVDDQIVHPDYLATALASEQAHRTLRARAKGLAGSMPKIDQEAIGSLQIPVPDLPAQAEVVAALASVDQANERLVRAIDMADQREHGLRRSLLSSAFSGDLPSSEPRVTEVEELAGV